MSTYLDFRCKTCNECAGLSGHRHTSFNDELFTRILGLREHITALESVADVLFYGTNEFDVLPHFFRHLNERIIERERVAMEPVE